MEAVGRAGQPVGIARGGDGGAGVDVDDAGGGTGLEPDPVVDVLHARVLIGGRGVVGDDRAGHDADTGGVGARVHGGELILDVLGRPALIDVVHAGDDHHHGRLPRDDILLEASG